MNLPTPTPGRVNCYCGALNVEGCVKCSFCTHCKCRCKRCNNCGRTHVGIKALCSVCRLCKRPPVTGRTAMYKCTCFKRPKAQPLRPASPKLFRSLRLRRPVGLELELAVVPVAAVDGMRAEAPLRCQWVHDGSVTAGGLELVTEPLRGETLLDGVTYLAQSFQRYGCAVDATCGYHVHIGEKWAKELGPLELRRLLLLYKRFEDVFYALVQEGRDKKKLNARGESKCYCQRLAWRPSWYAQLAKLQRPRDIRKFLIQSMYPDRYIETPDGKARVNMDYIRNHKYEACRYFGLNLHTWFERGTVEFRHHEGTMDRERILNWALWCAWFVEFASRLSDGQLAACTSLQQLLYEEWPTSTGPLRMPSDIAAYVWARREAQETKTKKENIEWQQPVLQHYYTTMDQQ